MDGLDHAAADRQCLVGDLVAGCRIAAWVDIADLHAGRQLDGLADQAPDGPGERGTDRATTDLAEHGPVVDEVADADAPARASRGRGKNMPRIISGVKSRWRQPTCSTMCGGIPMSIISSWPVYSTPGNKQWPVLANANVAVIWARTQVPQGRPVSEFKPEGMSTAKTGLLERLMNSMISLK